MIKILRLKDKGFTLLELLVAIGILGILVALAIPQFAAYRRRGFIAAVKSDLKNASIVEEAYYTANESYTASLTALLGEGFRQSSHVVMTITTVGGGYSFSATHDSCGADTWTYTGSGSIVDPPTPCQ